MPLRPLCMKTPPRQRYYQCKTVAEVLLLCMCVLMLPCALNGETDNLWPFSVEIFEDEADGSRGELERFKMGGPFIEQKFGGDTTWSTMRPIAAEFYHHDVEAHDLYYFYPLYRYHEYPDRYNWSLFSLVNRSVEGTNSEQPVKKFSIFPLVFSKETGNADTSYFGVMPIAGMVRDFLGYDTFSWAAFPLYAKFQEAENKRIGMPWPFIQWQEGPDASGFALWPLFGHFKKKGDYDRSFFLWPLMYEHVDQLEKDIPRVKRGFLPFYTSEMSENVESVTWLWPFFGYTDVKDPEYHETRYLWPFMVQGRGEHKYVNRWAPFYSHSIIHGTEKKWWLWPMLRWKQWEEQGLEITQQQLFYFIFWHNEQRSLSNPDLDPAIVSTLWPFYTYYDNGAGHTQVQALSPLQPFFPHNEVVKVKYNPLFALYRYEEKPEGEYRHSLAWDLVVHEREGPGKDSLEIGPLFKAENDPERPGVEILGGLLGIRNSPDKGLFLRLLWSDVELQNDANGDDPEVVRRRR